MIRTAITGADLHEAGELIRLLINHPDVELTQLVSVEKAGLPVTSVHHGMIGECNATFDAELSTEKTDAIICVGNIPAGLDYLNGPKLIWIPQKGADRISSIPDDMVFGQPETHRKPLVRGARAAVVPSPFVSAIVASVSPLLHLLPNDALVRIQLTASDIVLKQMADVEGIKKELEWVIKRLKPDARFDIQLATQTAEYGRVGRVNIKLRLTNTLDEVMQMYNAVYDDHNFSYLVSNAVETCEVEGTEKCLIALNATGNHVNIDSVSDMYMRGGAGEAVHLLNLLFGLHEQTGLKLRAFSY